MRVVVLAGGKGARLLPYTKILPKPLMPIGDMPILEVILRQMKNAGYDDIVITVGHLSELIRAFFGNGEHLGLRISYNYEDKPLGTAGPLARIEGLNDPFLVINGDILTTLDFGELLRFHKEQQAVATIAAQDRKTGIDFGIIQWGAMPEIGGYIEKPNYEFTVSMGIYVFDPRVIHYIPVNKYLDFPDLVHKLIDAGEKIVGYRYDGYWQDLGRKDDYEQAMRDFEKMRIQFLPEA